MEFLDEQIAKLQKEARIAKKYSNPELEEHEDTELEDESITELSQEEVTQAIKNGLFVQNEEKFTFDNKICFEGKMIIPVLEEFFDESIENEGNYYWNKKHVFSISLSRVEFKDDTDNINDFLEKMKNLFKENEVYIEFLDSKEEINESFSKYIITSRMPTSLDYIFQYMIYIKFKDDIYSLIFTCLDKDKKRWEKIMVGIGELMEIKKGDKECNE